MQLLNNLPGFSHKTLYFISTDGRMTELLDVYVGPIGHFVSIAIWTMDYHLPVYIRFSRGVRCYHLATELKKIISSIPKLRLPLYMSN